MQVPKRKKENWIRPKADPHISQGKFDALERRLIQLKEVERPQMSIEVKRLAEMGDFSENAGYQLSKSKLRGINNKILKIEHHLKHAIIIEKTNTSTVQLGHTVTIEVNGKEKEYTIMGSAEVNLDRNTISHNSPIGSALIGHEVGDEIDIKLKDRTLRCKILDIT